MIYLFKPTKEFCKQGYWTYNKNQFCLVDTKNFTYMFHENIEFCINIYNSEIKYRAPNAEKVIKSDIIPYLNLVDFITEDTNPELFI